MILRNSKGHVVLATAAFYGIGSNMMAECMAMLDGLKLTRQYGLENNQFLVEFDSKMLVQMVLGKVEIPHLQFTLGDTLIFQSVAFCHYLAECFCKRIKLDYALQG